MSTTTRYSRVPYITSWSAERSDTGEIVKHPGGGIAFADETAEDRDDHGVLWRRGPSAHGEGIPQFKAVHGARQRHVMSHLLCQVCAGPADQNDDDGTLWLLPDHRTDWPDWPQRMDVTEPPICAQCLTVATKLCPALRKGHAVVRAFTAPVVGVLGAVYTPSSAGLVVAGVTVVDFVSPTIRWTLAHQLVRNLHQAVIVT